MKETLMTRETDAAWLAGIIDGEGCICGYWTNRHNKTGGNVHVDVRIQATSMAMISRVFEICEKNDIEAYVETGGLWRPLSTKPTYRIGIRKRAEVSKLFALIRPYLVVKLPEVDFAMSWFEKWGDQRGNHQRKAEHDEKILFFNTLRDLKKIA